MLKVYGDYRSGNCYKIKLMLHLLDQPYEWIAINILRGETRSEEFLKKNPNGKIPVLELEDGSCLWESNAILNYLAEGSEFLPTDPRLRTQVLQWQFFEQYSQRTSRSAQPVGAPRAVNKEACGRPDPVPQAFFYMNEPTLSGMWRLGGFSPENSRNQHERKLRRTF